MATQLAESQQQPTEVAASSPAAELTSRPKQGWTLRDGRLCPSSDLLLERSAAQAQHVDDNDPLVSFVFSKDGAAAETFVIRCSVLLFASGPLAVLAGDSFAEGRTKVVNLPEEIDPLTFSIVRQFLYLEKIDLSCIDADQVLHVCKASHQWELTELFDLSTQYLAYLVGSRRGATSLLLECGPLVASRPDVSEGLRIAIAKNSGKVVRDIVEGYTDDPEIVAERARKESDGNSIVSQFESERSKKDSICDFWESFTPLMAACFIQNSTADDAALVIGVILSQFADRMSGKDVLSLLRICRWKDTSSKEVLDTLEDLPNISPRALRLAVYASMNVRRHDERHGEFRASFHGSRTKQNRSDAELLSFVTRSGCHLSLRFERNQSCGTPGWLQMCIFVEGNKMCSGWSRISFMLNCTGCVCGRDGMPGSGRGPYNWTLSNGHVGKANVLSLDLLERWPMDHDKECELILVVPFSLS